MRKAEFLSSVCFVKILTSRVACVYWVHSAGVRFSIRFPWREKVWSPPLILLIKWKHSGLPTVRQHYSTHTCTVAKVTSVGVSMGNYTQAPTSHSVVSSYAVRSHTRLTCNTLQIMSINKQGMFYLKGRTLIQRHHSSTEKKCCLISVTPLLLPSSRKREREAMCHSCHTDILSPEILVCLSD